MTGQRAASSNISVQAVEGRALTVDFLRLPERLYREDPAWVSPLLLEQKHRVFNNTPFLEHAITHAWVAYAGDQPIGRITAQLDRLQPGADEGAVGYFGMLEAIDDAAVFRDLTGAAEDWLREQGAAWIRGPYNLSINEEVGLLVENFSEPPFFMMGHARPYYGPRLEEQGYSGIKDLLTYMIDTSDYEPSASLQRLAGRSKSSVRVRPLNRQTRKADFEIMRDIFNDGWSGNWGFVPFTRREFQEMGSMLSLLLDHDYVQIAEINERPVAFIVALPNVNEAIADLDGRLFPFGWIKLLWRLRLQRSRTARIALMGVRRELQHSRLGPTLAFMVIDAAARTVIRRGVQRVEMGWILEDNSAMRHIIEDVGGAIYKRYRIYQKKL